MGSFYGIGNWSKLPIKHDEKVFITTSTMKNPIIARYWDYGEIYSAKTIGEFNIYNEDLGIILSDKNTQEEIVDFINKNIKKPSKIETEYDLYIDHLFLYRKFENDIVKNNESIFELLTNNYFIPDNSCFCSSQDDINITHLKFYTSIYEFVNQNIQF